MVKIETLSKEQEALFPQYRDEGLKVGYDTNTDYDLDLVKGLINEVRALSDKKLPPVKEWIQLDSPYEACKIEGVTPYNALYGQQDIHWLQFYKYFREVCGLTEETQRTVAMRELCNHIGWWWFSEDKVIITKKPSYIGTSTRKATWGDAPIVHDTEGMAIKYLDGTGCYKLDDILIPEAHHWLFTDKSKRTAENIMGINNVDVRNAALKLLGPDGLISAMPHDVIEEKTIQVAHTPKGKLDIRYVSIASLINMEFNMVDSHYRLIGLDLNGIYRIYLNGVCPSKGEQFTEAVPPTCKTIDSALNWRETGVIEGSYTPPALRT
jgi:hypothetical protein